MNIQERVLAVLKPLVASNGFGATTVEGLATNLSASLSDESTDEDIIAAIEGAKPYFTLMQSENTRYINEYKKKNPTPPNPNPQPNNPNPANPAPQVDKISELEKKIDQLLQYNNSLSLTQKWEKLAEANGIKNATLVTKWQPQTEEEFDSAMEDLKAFNKDHVKQNANDRSPGKPNAGGALPEASKTLTATGKQVLENLKAQNERNKTN
ncbi:hypothetical protein [Sphingobacterium deserti]|uniref:Uncharacterized protein n=1 Tax=Sphingobacterium deserti TaxID=1229276 RepID=A0A0B8T1Q8_9SPHI|nr:hypothetical protein [Sphingobacterium deserti]KGE14626.1 hypothetical protein DI53_1655 [Sphingobacterium deserti]